MNGIYIPNMKMPKRNATFLVHVNGDEIDFIPSCKYEEEFKEKRKTYKIIPTADVRPVVLCKDCKCYRQSSFIDEHMECARSGFPVHSVDFCSLGEKREES